MDWQWCAKILDTVITQLTPEKGKGVLDKFRSDVFDTIVKQRMPGNFNDIFTELNDSSSILEGTICDCTMGLCLLTLAKYFRREDCYTRFLRSIVSRVSPDRCANNLLLIKCHLYMICNQELVPTVLEDTMPYKLNLLTASLATEVITKGIGWLALPMSNPNKFEQWLQYIQAKHPDHYECYMHLNQYLLERLLRTVVQRRQYSRCIMHTDHDSGAFNPELVHDFIKGNPALGVFFIQHVTHISSLYYNAQQYLNPDSQAPATSRCLTP